MKSCKKFANNSGNGHPATSSTEHFTQDYLFLLSEYEYHGAITYADSLETGYLKQYDYYKAGNSKVHYRHDNTGSAVYAWPRSADAGDGYYFCRVNTDGAAGYGTADASWALAPGFAA